MISPLNIGKIILTIPKCQSENIHQMTYTVPMDKKRDKRQKYGRVISFCSTSGIRRVTLVWR